MYVLKYSPISRSNDTDSLFQHVYTLITFFGLVHPNVFDLLVPKMYGSPPSMRDCLLCGTSYWYLVLV